MRGGETAAGVDLGELVVVADQDHLRHPPAARGEDVVEVDGAAHPGLVHDNDRCVAVMGSGAGVVVKRGTVNDTIPAPVSSSRAARADGATPTTSQPAVR